jgi:hypothetical protein
MSLRATELGRRTHCGSPVATVSLPFLVGHLHQLKKIKNKTSSKARFPLICPLSGHARFLVISNQLFHCSMLHLFGLPPSTAVVLSPPVPLGLSALHQWGKSFMPGQSSLYFLFRHSNCGRHTLPTILLFLLGHKDCQSQRQHHIHTLMDPISFHPWASYPFFLSTPFCYPAFLPRDRDRFSLNS